MGDTKSHEAVFKSSIKPILNAVLPGRDRDSIFFEVGNFLTDVSQFRDPLAYFSAKFAIYKKSMPFFRGLANLDDYLDDLMGTKAKPWGYLSQWFEQIVFCIMVEKFRKEGVSPDEIKDIFFPRPGNKIYFTQYFPHEHLDFPPWPLGDAMGDRSKSMESIHICQRASNGTHIGSRKNLKYLEFQIVFISDLLTLIENDWSRLIEDRDSTQNTKKLHAILMQFGHACHVIEDFYFHSNFVEIAWLKILHEKHSEPSERDYWVWIYENVFSNYREKRIFYRRLHAPVSIKGNNINTALSTEVYTGGFGDKDIFHTFYDLLLGLPPNVREILEILRGVGYPFWLLEYIIYEEKREELRKGEDSKVNEIVIKHQKQLKNNEIQKGARLASFANKLHPFSVEAIRKACDLDKKLGESYSLIRPGKRYGVGGFLLKLAQMLQQEHHDSEIKRNELDRKHVVFDSSFFNGATAEIIGSHSLLAKDSAHKQPLYDEAMTSACFVSAYFVKLMLHQVYSNPNKKRMDWLHVLRHFICHPEEARNLWYKRAFLGERSKNECMMKYLNPNNKRDKTEITNRMKQEMKMKLELAYFRMEEEADSRWQNR
jgi:hypothetical protein